MRENATHSFVVCHMLTSLDGKIDGRYMNDSACGSALAAYGKLRKYYDCQAVLYGTVTMQGSYSDGLAPEFTQEVPSIVREDYIAMHDAENYIISVDPTGTLGFDSGYIEKKGRPRAHVIEVLSKQVSDAYLWYLREKGVSYIFAGEENLDCSLILEKLQNSFGIQRLMIAGGGYMNYSFLQEDLIDELSLVIAPLADGNTKSVSIFEQSEFLAQRAPSVFSLAEVEKLDGDVLWLRYVLKK